MNKVQKLKTGKICPKCFKDISECCGNNNGWNRCQPKKPNLILCSNCLNPIEICKCENKNKKSS